MSLDWKARVAYLTIAAVAIVRIAFSFSAKSGLPEEFIFPFLIFLALFASSRFFGRGADLAEATGLGPIAIVLGALAFLAFSGIFSGGQIQITDYPISAYRMRSFQGTFSYDSGFGAGIVDSFVQPPGAFALGKAALLSSGFAEDLAVRIIAVLSFILVPLGIWFFLRKGFGVQGGLATLAGMAWLAFPHDEFIHGMYSSYLSLGIALIATGLLLGENETRLSGILFGTAILIHVLIGVSVLASIGMHFLLFRRRDIGIALSAASGGIALSLFWLAPALIARDAYSFLNLPKLYPFLFDFGEIFLRRFIFRNPEIFAIPIIFLLSRANSRETGARDASELSSIFIFALSLACASFLSRTIFPETLSQVMPDRFVLVARAFGISASFAIIGAISKGGGDRSAARNLAILVSAPIIFYSIISPLAVSGNERAFSLIHGGGTYDSWFGLDTHTPLLSQKTAGELFKTSKWLAENSGSRVLFDDESAPSLGGRPAPTIAILSGRPLIGGPIPTATYWGRNTEIYDRFFFGKNLSEYSPEELSGELTSLGVGIALSRKEALSEALLSSGWRKVSEAGEISAFRSDKPPLNFSGKGNAIAVYSAPLKLPLKKYPFFSSDGLDLAERPDKFLTAKAPGTYKIEYRPPPIVAAIEFFSLSAFSFLIVFASRSK